MLRWRLVWRFYLLLLVAAYFIGHDYIGPMLEL